jgi:putative tryptophan/tyrosine transport system substrate-binding protein
MRRIGLAVVVTVVCLTGPLTAQQLTRVPRIGVLVNADSPRVEAFRHGLREQGYTDGRNVFIEYRYASARSESLDVLARELMHLKVDVIVTEGTPPTLAARRATDSIPIVVTSAGDLVGAGLVASLARPGGNVTGLTLQLPELSGKRLAPLAGSRPQRDGGGDATESAQPSPPSAHMAGDGDGGKGFEDHAAPLRDRAPRRL